MPLKKSDLSRNTKKCRDTKRRRQLEESVLNWEIHLAQNNINYTVLAEQPTDLAEMSRNKLQICASESLEQREICLAQFREKQASKSEKARKKQAQYRASQTPEQRAKRLEQDRQRKARMRAREDRMQRLQRLKIEREKKAIQRAKKAIINQACDSLTLEQVVKARNNRARDEETPEQREKRLEADRQRKAQQRASEDPEEREIRLLVERRLKALQRKTNVQRNCPETPEQRELRLATFEESKAQLLAWKREALQRVTLAKIQQAHEMNDTETPTVYNIELAEPRKRKQERYSLNTSEQQTGQKNKSKRQTYKRSRQQYLPGSSRPGVDGSRPRIKCYYLACTNTSAEKSMFRFPWNDAERLQVWLTNCGNLELGDLPPATLRSRYLCIDHFDDKYLRSKAEGGKKQLLKTAIPEPWLTNSIDNIFSPGTLQDSADEYSITIEVDPIYATRTAEVPSVSGLLKQTTSVNMEAEEVIPEVTVKNEIEIEEERLIKVKTEVPDYQNAPTHTETIEAYESTQITIKIEPDFESKVDSYLVERDDIVEKPKEVESLAQVPVSIKQENVQPMVSYDYPNIDDGGSMDSSEAAALANVETCLQDDINIKNENGVHLEDSNKEEFLCSEVKIESDTNSSFQIIPDILNYAAESTSLLVESDKSEFIGNDFPIKNVQCPKCPKQFNNKYILKTHLKVHQTIENYRNGLKRALETKRKNIFKKRLRQSSLQTPDVNESQETCTSYQTMSDDNKEGYKCTCGKTYQRKTRMESCLRSHDDCEKDTTSFLEGPSGSEMIDSNPFQLNSITGNFLSLEQEAYNMMKRQVTFPCPKCKKKTFYKEYKLKNHLKFHAFIERKQLEKKGLKSKKCKNMQSLLQQADEHESQDSCSNYQDNRVENKEGYKCTCGKTFQRKTRMESCLRSHDCCESEKYYCMTCLKDFRSKDELAKHRKRLHRKKFSCKFCPTDYATRKKLFKHLQIHQKVDQMEYKVIEEVVKEKKKLSCLLCSQFYDEISELKIHVMSEHKGPYSCPHCKNTFPKINDFANHTKTYHPEVGGQKVLDVIEAFSRLTQEWKCDECGLQFLEADKLALHQVEEHNPELKSEHQFQCPDCRRVFHSQKGLTSHRRIHHSNETSEQAKVEVTGILCLECRKMCKDMAALTSHMRFHSPDRKYPCKFCDFRFATPEKRKTHAEIHTGEMKYVCFICEYQCSSENRLKKHKHSLKHTNMREYLLTGKPLIEDATPKDKEKKVAKKGNSSKDVDSDSNVSSSDGEEVSCDICGEKFPGETEMLEHKETHPFIEIPNADNQPTRIFFK